MVSQYFSDKGEKPSDRDWYAEITKRTKEAFPESFANPNRERAADVGSTGLGSNESKKGKKPSYNDLPQEAKSAARNMIFPNFDIILLGMGSDGHIASLFPGSELLKEKKKWVAAVPQEVGSPAAARVTLTLPVFNQATNILFLISGSKKRKILDTILSNPAEAEEIYPAALIKPAGNLIWLVAEKD